MDKFLKRLIELLKEDQELHNALLELIKAKIESEKALTEYRKKRSR